ncbi:mediator complex subunit MED6 [Besnoitia besnoiti]|uniref:Mediator of RNA polymerase II transcription subunit 6 n=1 Tax=Besnoitia besnoiti TaxID=94643 RepID=A0A2A9MCH8_BESBE|nr:mediator complex subunit MED6 [Besnoitia besnoiti]PFH33636.1 mediator complex subunit MED6 [Besnoitia besnoiti]
MLPASAPPASASPAAAAQASSHSLSSSSPSSSHSCPPFPAYRQGALQRECALEFADWRWLCSHALDSEGAALEYFYLSPFYVEMAGETLNERLRRGERNLSDLQGRLFSVTYSNLDVLRSQVPGAAGAAGAGAGAAGAGAGAAGAGAGASAAEGEGGAAELGVDFAARCTFFNSQALFHITLLKRELARHGAIHTVPLRVYAVISGKIYRVPPLSDIIQQKMAAAMGHLEGCFDVLQGRLARWSLANGYTWRDSGTNLRAGARHQAACDTESDPDEGLCVNEVFKKPGCEPAVRVLHEEQNLLTSEIAALMERKRQAEKRWGAQREAEAKLLAAMEKKVAAYRQLKIERLRKLPPSQHLEFLLRQKKQLEQRAQERAAQAEAQRAAFAR